MQEVCREIRRPRILSVANGAVREAEPVVEMCRAAGGSFVVVDGCGEPPDIFRPDGDLRLVRYISYPYGVLPSRENIGDFHYVYSLNLLSELNQQQARAAIANMLSLVCPGGRLLLSSFSSEIADTYLGGFYRGEEDIAALVPDSRSREILGHAIWRDESRSILYLEIQKVRLVRREATPGSGFLHEKD